MKSKKVVRLACQGGENLHIPLRFLPEVDSCAAAHQLDKTGCVYGCLGLGDCVSICPEGAMEIKENLLVEIDEMKCTGCGLCLQSCPRQVLILLDDRKKGAFVRCNATGMGKDKTTLCHGACIGCKSCELRCPFDALKIVDGLAEIDYSKCRDCGFCADSCPAILDYCKVIAASDPMDKDVAVIDADKCIGCGLCAKACPMSNTINGQLRKPYRVNIDFCVGCGICLEKCKKDAIRMIPRRELLGEKTE